MRTRIVPFGCALVLALAGCGGDDDNAAKPKPLPPTQTRAEQLESAKKSAEAKMEGTAVRFVDRGGKQIPRLGTEKAGRRFCKDLRDRGVKQLGGEAKVTIETPDGDLTCDLTKGG